jgi:hypothetical protein
MVGCLPCGQACLLSARQASQTCGHARMPAGKQPLPLHLRGIRPALRPRWQGADPSHCPTRSQPMPHPARPREPTPSAPLAASLPAGVVVGSLLPTLPKAMPRCPTAALPVNAQQRPCLPARLLLPASPQPGLLFPEEGVRLETPPAAPLPRGGGKACGSPPQGAPPCTGSVHQPNALYTTLAACAIHYASRMRHTLR